MLRLPLFCRRATDITPRARSGLFQVPLLSMLTVILDLINVALDMVLLQSNKACPGLRVVVELLARLA
jgi:hypothetical protein